MKMLDGMYGHAAGNTGYASISRMADETFYRGWFDKNLVGGDYRALSDAVTRRGRWSKKLDDLSQAIDGLGKAKRRDIRHLTAVRDALEAYGQRGYLGRSIRKGKTSQAAFDDVLEKLDTYIGAQTDRRRYVRNTAIRTAAAAGIMAGAFLGIDCKKKTDKYDADREALRALNTRTVAEQVDRERQPDTEILEQVEKAVADEGPGDRTATRPGHATTVPRQARDQVAGMLERPAQDYRPEPAEIDLSGTGQQEDEPPVDLLCIAEQFLDGDLADAGYTITPGHGPAGDMPGQESGEPKPYKHAVSSKDPFNAGMKLRPLTEYSTESERLMRLAGEAHTRGEEHKARALCIEAICYGTPDMDGLAGDTNGDGIIDGDDTPLMNLIEGNIEKSDAYLDKAWRQLKEDDRVGAYVTTHMALRYNRDCQDEVDDIRGKCNVIEVVLGDFAAYGDKLLDDSGVSYGLVRIKPGDFGTYRTSLGGSLDETGKHAGKTLNDAGRTLHKSVNTLVGVGDGIVSTALNVTEATLGKLGQLIGLNKDVNYDAVYARRQVDLDQRTQSGYGSLMTYIGVEGGLGEFLGDVWTIGNGAVNTAGGVVLVAYNGAVRTPVEGIGGALGGEEGFRGAHELAGLGQIPICVLIDNVPALGKNEKQKAQSYALTKLAEGLYLYAPTHSNLMDRNMDGSVDIGEFALSLPIVQGVLRPYDSESSMTERVLRVIPNAWAAERAYDHCRGNGRKVVTCTEPGRTGGGPVKESAPGRGGGAPTR